jgi:general secretion pathway protein K
MRTLLCIGLRARVIDARNRENGVALVVVLWMLVLLAVMAVGFASSARSDLLMVRNQYEAARARAIADAGVSLAIMGLLDPSPTTTWHRDGTSTALDYSGGTIVLSIQDEAGKIDLNAASAALLTNLLDVVGVDRSSDIAMSIEAWKAARLPVRAGGAPNAATASGDVPPQAFQTIEDLRLVPGIPPALFAKIAPFITVYSHTAAIDPLTAPLAVLASVPDANPRTLQALVVARAQAVPVPGTLPMLNDPLGLEPRPRFQTLTVRSTGTTAGGTAFIREAVVLLTGDAKQPFRFLTWRQAQEP